MNYLNKLFALLFAVGMAMGCSSDDTSAEADGGAQVHPDDKVYVSVSVSLPAGGGYAERDH